MATSCARRPGDAGPARFRRCGVVRGYARPPQSRGGRGAAGGRVWRSPREGGVRRAERGRSSGLARWHQARPAGGVAHVGAAGSGGSVCRERSCRERPQVARCRRLGSCLLDRPVPAAAFPPRGRL